MNMSLRLLYPGESKDWQMYTLNTRLENEMESRQTPLFVWKDMKIGALALIQTHPFFLFFFFLGFVREQFQTKGDF